MLGTLDADEKNDWPEYVLPLVHAYNCIRHSSTGYSPYFLMFGHTLRFPINVSLGVTFENGVTQLYTVYAENLCTCLQYAHDLAVQNAQKKVESNKKRYDAHTSRGKNKLKDRWEDIPYLVTGRVEDLPVYVVQQEGTRKKRTLHRNLLLPYHVPHETLHTTLTTGTDPAPSTRSRGHPQTIRLANVDSDGGYQELEPIVVITTEKNIFYPGTWPFVPAANEEQT